MSWFYVLCSELDMLFDTVLLSAWALTGSYNTLQMSDCALTGSNDTFSNVRLSTDRCLWHTQMSDWALTGSYDTFSNVRLSTDMWLCHSSNVRLSTDIWLHHSSNVRRSTDMWSTPLLCHYTVQYNCLIMPSCFALASDQPVACRYSYHHVTLLYCMQ